MADEARSLQYSISVNADTGQAESSIRNLTSSLGNMQSTRVSVNADTSGAESGIRRVTSELGDVQNNADSAGSAFRKSFLAGIDSGDSFASSLKQGVGGAFSYVKSEASDMKSNVVNAATGIKEGFTHPIETIKTGLGNAIQTAKDKFTSMVRSADEAADAVDELGDSSEDAADDIDEAGDAADRSSSKFSGFGTVLKGIGTAVLAATTAVAALGAAAIKAGTEYETAFAQVQTIMDTTQMSTEDMSDSIKALSSEMGISASDLSNTVYNAISATGDTANAVNLAEQASKLATAGFTDTSSALSVLTTAMNAYGLSADEASNISDSLIQVQNLGVTTVAELSSSMGKAIASASAYGVDLTNLESAYVSITKAGINTAEGTTYISSMMKELGDSGTEVAGILQSKTGKSFDQLMKEGKSLGDVLGILYDSVDGDSTALMNLWSSAEAGKASAAIIGQGLDTFNENLIAIGESAGATENAYSIMADTLEHKTAVFKTAGTNLLSSIYEGMSGELGEIMDFANGAMSELADAFEEGGLPALMGALGNVLGEGLNMIVGMLPDVIDAAMQLLGAFGQAILDNLPTIVGAAAQIVVTLATGIGDALPDLIPAIVDTLILVVETIIENLPLILDAGMSILSGLVEGIVNALPILVDALPELILSIVDFLSENLPTILDQGAQLLMTLANGILEAIPQLVAQLPTIITSIVDFVANNLPLIVETGINLIIQLAAGIIQAIPQLVAQLPQIITAIVNGIGALMGSILEIGKNIVKGIWEGISSMVSWIGEKVSGFFSNILGGVKSFLGISSPSKVFAGIGGYMAQGLGEGFTSEMGSVEKDIEKSVPTELDLPTVNAPDVNYGVTAVTDSGAAVNTAVPDVSYHVSGIVDEVNTPNVNDVTYGVTPVVGDFTPSAYSGVEAAAGTETTSAETASAAAPAFAPNITITVQGNADSEAIEDMRSSIYDTVRELFQEFREEELERQSLKNQYAFG